MFDKFGDVARAVEQPQHQPIEMIQADRPMLAIRDHVAARGLTASERRRHGTFAGLGHEGRRRRVYLYQAFAATGQQIVLDPSRLGIHVEGGASALVAGATAAAARFAKSS